VVLRIMYLDMAYNPLRAHAALRCARVMTQRLSEPDLDIVQTT